MPTHAESRNSNERPMTREELVTYFHAKLQELMKSAGKTAITVATGVAGVLTMSSPAMAQQVPQATLSQPAKAIPPEWIGEFQRGVTDAQKMEWMQKSPEKLMAYMRWHKEEQTRLDAANQKGTEDLKKLKEGNGELRRVAQGLQGLTAR